MKRVKKYDELSKKEQRQRDKEMVFSFVFWTIYYVLVFSFLILFLISEKIVFLIIFFILTTIMVINETIWFRSVFKKNEKKN